MSALTSIIVSGLPGAGKSTLITRLAELYHWPTHAIGQLFRDKWAEVCPDQSTSFEVWWKNLSLDEQRRVNDDLKRLIEAGNIIANSRYSVYCEDLPALRIFVTAPRTVRALRALGSEKYPGLNADKIYATLGRRERDEREIGERIFSFNYQDPEHYHFCLNSFLLSVEEEVEVVSRFMEKRGTKAF